MMNLALTTLLAEDPINTGPDFGKASPVGLLVVMLLLIAVLLLGWSMSRQLKKVPASFDDTEPETAPVEDTAAATTTAEAGTADAGTAEAGTEGSAGESNG